MRNLPGKHGDLDAIGRLWNGARWQIKVAELPLYRHFFYRCQHFYRCANRRPPAELLKLLTRIGEK